LGRERGIRENHVRLGEMFRLDFCTLRYVITREFGVDKLRVGWGIRAKRFEERIKKSEETIIKSCWRKKEANEWKDLYERERKGFYERNGWRIEEISREKDNVEEEIISRERERLRYTEEKKLKRQGIIKDIKRC